jgi:hypothetical protein
MLWQSKLTSAAAFVRAVKKDPDLVYVTRADGRRSLSVSGALETDDNMAVYGPDRAWRVNVHMKGRRAQPVQIKLPKRRKG